MNPLVVMATKKASELRRQFKLDKYQPINVLDLCLDLGITVRILDINMEGMYIQPEKGRFPQILLSNQRPLPRRNFTCAHELGHHLFGHGTRIDMLVNQSVSEKYDKDEFLVDSFAGALLMPVPGILIELKKRNWDITTITPQQMFTISSIFGVGYSTLITHCRVNKIISDSIANSLLKVTPAKILENNLGSMVNNSHFKLIDDKMPLTAIDLEVSNFVFIPENTNVEGNHLAKYKSTTLGTAYIAEKPGIVRIASKDNTLNFLARIQNKGYFGLAENRHLETIE